MSVLVVDGMVMLVRIGLNEIWGRVYRFLLLEGGRRED